MRVLRSRKRWLVTAAVFVVLASAGTAAWALTRQSSASAAATTTTATVASSDLSRTVAATGTVEPKRQQTVTFPVSGTVTSVPVAVGQTVSQGAVLGTVDTTSLQSAVDTATAAVSAAQSQITAVASSSATQIASAKAQLAQAQSQLTSARQNLTAASLTAPFAGVVASVGYAVGDVVGSGSAGGSTASGGSGGSTTGGTGGTGTAGGGGSGASASSTSSGITLITTDAWVVNVNVGSADLAELKKGLQAQITPTGARGTVFGTVSSIGIVASSASGGTATFPVVIDVTGTPTGLFAGASATVSIIIQRLSGVLTVATAAVSTQAGTTVVHKVVGGKQVVTPITVGAAYGPLTEVKSGLRVGDQVAFTTPFGGGAGNGARNRTRGTGGDFPGGGFPGGGLPGGGFGGGAAPGGNG